MNNTLKKVIGIEKTKFDDIVFRGKEEIKKTHQARLIPSYKPGDELALTSIFLSALRLIHEFKRDLFSEMKMLQGGKLFVYNEIELPIDLKIPELKKSRFDGLIIITKSGIIRDAAILEVKTKNDDLDQEQIQKYLDVAKAINIPKIVTISNQFVSLPTQSPLDLRVPKNISLFHLSWSYIRTIANILLFKNENNIKDEDQVEIMKEVVNYFEDSTSGVCGFTQMKKGWSKVVEKIKTGTTLKESDKDIDETVVSWQQEERDMALDLSRKLGILVRSGSPKFRDNLHLRIANDKQKLIKNKRLESILKVKDAVSDIKVNALFNKGCVEMSVKINAPQDKGIKGQIGWLKRQMKTCSNKETKKLFDDICNDLKIGVNIKHAKGYEWVAYNDIDSIIENYKNKEINDFTIIQVKDFGRNFSSNKRFVKMIEEMLINFYKSLVQYLTNWKQPAPKIIDNNNNESEKSE